MTAPHRGFSGPMKHNQRNNRTQQQQLLRIPTGQLAIYKCSWEVEPGTTRNKFNEWSERVLDPGSPDLKASALTTGPHYLLSGRGIFDSGRSQHTEYFPILSSGIVALTLLLDNLSRYSWRESAAQTHSREFDSRSNLDFFFCLAYKTVMIFRLAYLAFCCSMLVIGSSLFTEVCMTKGIRHTPTHTKVCKFVKFQLTFSQLICIGNRMGPSKIKD